MRSKYRADAEHAARRRLPREKALSTVPTDLYERIRASTACDSLTREQFFAHQQ